MHIKSFKSWRAFVLSIVMIGGAIGVVPQPAKGEPAPAVSSARQAARDVVIAARTGDLELLRRNAIASNEQLTAIRSASEVLMELTKYQERVHATFGDKVTPSHIIVGGLDMTVTEAAGNQGELTVDGDNATLAAREYPQIRLPLKKHDGTWKLDLTQMRIEKLDELRAKQAVEDIRLFAGLLDSTGVEKSTERIQRMLLTRTRGQVRLISPRDIELAGLSGGIPNADRTDKPQDDILASKKEQAHPATAATGKSDNPSLFDIASKDKTGMAPFAVPGNKSGPNGRVFADADAARRIIFICDASGSMLDKWGALTMELNKALTSLTPFHSFDILFFRDQGFESFAARKHRAGLVIATPDAKHEAREFLGDISARGPTDPIPAIEAAFKSNPQLIYLLTDGDFPNNEAVLGKIRELTKNKQGKTRINTIAFTGRNDNDVKFIEMLKTIAKETGGTFRQVKADELE